MIAFRNLLPLRLFSLKRVPCFFTGMIHCSLRRLHTSIPISPFTFNFVSEPRGNKYFENSPPAEIKLNIAYDLRGHGGSDKPHDVDQYGMPEVEDLVRLLDHLEIRQAHLVGYSRGGLIANGFPNRHPGRILSVTFGGYGHDAETSGPIESTDRTKVAEAIAQGDLGPFMHGTNPPGQPEPSPEQVAMISKRIMGRNDPKALAASFLGDGTVSTLAREQLENNTIPVLAQSEKTIFLKEW